MEKILRRIVDARIQRLAFEGAGQGITLPTVERRRENYGSARPFPPEVICEVKRRSPSRGTFDAAIDAGEMGRRYHAAGVRAISVLTEQDHFGGSLRDVLEVKRAVPELAVLRKDFLLSIEDVDASFVAGADAVLVIVRIIDDRTLSQILQRVAHWGMHALVEVHSRTDIDRVRPFTPPIVGINCRDLSDFSIDPLLPFAVKEELDWECRVVYESGITSVERAYAAWRAGFASCLVGEHAIRERSFARDLVRAAKEIKGTARSSFWSYVARRRVLHPARPLVKVCGVRRADDAREVNRNGGDLVGVVFAASPRRIGSEEIVKVREAVPRMPLVAVTVANQREEVRRALIAYRDQLVDAIQLHRGGLASPWRVVLEEAGDIGVQAEIYCVVQPRRGEKESLKAVRGVRFLLDAPDHGSGGGQGITVDEQVVRDVIHAMRARGERSLWLAGGVNAENVASIVRRWQPELIDLSSGVERSPGVKDSRALQTLFAAMQGME